MRAAEEEDPALLDIVHIVEAFVDRDRVLAAVAARVVLLPRRRSQPARIFFARAAVRKSE